MEGTVSFPPSVKQGDEFDLVLTLTNPGTEPIFLKHIVIHHDGDAPYLLDGATVLSTDPAMKSEPFAVGNDVQFLYFREIEPGETQTVILHMQAENTGVYLANVGVYGKDPRLPEPAFLHAYHFFAAQMEIRPF